MVYDKRNFDNANNVFTSLQKAAQGINMIVDEPHWIELDNFNQADVFERQLQDYVKKGKEPLIVLLMLPQERQYK